jgi:hypothetical protein
VFKTDKGIFAVVSHFGKDSSEQSGPNDLDYHAHKITLDKNNCVSSLKETGTAGVSICLLCFVAALSFLASIQFS